MTPRPITHSPWLLTAAAAMIAFTATGIAADKKSAGKEEEKAAPDFTRKIEMRPSEKRSLALRVDERNPYGRDIGEIKVIEDKEGVPEEDLIRKVFSQLTIGGRSVGPDGPRVLVGDMYLEEGQVVPPVIEDQSEQLVVVKISKEEIELAWFDPETGDLTGRRLNLKFDLKPVVNYIMNGQRGRTDKENAAIKPAFTRMRATDLPAPKIAENETSGVAPHAKESRPATIIGPNAGESGPPTAQNGEAMNPPGGETFPPGE